MDLAVIVPAHGESFLLQLPQMNLRIGEIKEFIQLQRGIPVASQTLFFNRQLLEDHLYLSQTPIVDLSQIDLHIQGFPLPFYLQQGYNPGHPAPEYLLQLTGPGPYVPLPYKLGDQPYQYGNNQRLGLIVLYTHNQDCIVVEVSPWDRVGVLRSLLRRSVAGLTYPLPENYGCFYHHGMAPMKEDDTFESHGVWHGDKIAFFRRI